MRKTVPVFCVIFIFALSAVAPPQSQSSTSISAEEALRTPFRLELPELGATITEAEARIARHDLSKIRLRVLKPYADLIDYGKIYTAINGEASGTIQAKNAANDGYLVTCNIDLKPRFRLRPGKNVNEISASDRNGRLYYASYVLLAGGAQGDDGVLAKGAAVEYRAVETGEDRDPPTVYLIEPKASVQLSGASGTARVQGVVGDNSGAVASVTVNGEAASLSAAPASRAIMVRPGEKTASGERLFERTVTIPEGAQAVSIEARDRAGNMTRVLIPVRRREAAISSQFSGRKYAIIVGVSRYKYNDGGLTDLAYADTDARAIRDFLRRREGGGFNASDILYLENEGATLNGIREALSAFLPKAGKDDLLFVFLAGHGSPDPYEPNKLYFLMHDTKVADMQNTALNMRELQEVLDIKVRAERVVVLVDTCHSAGLSGKQIVTARGLENNLINLYATRLYKEEGRAVLTSSDINEVSQEGERWGGGHGVFTFSLLEAFRGAADTNRDNLITAGELFAYERDRVRVETAFSQNPTALPGLNSNLTLAVVAKK